MVSEAPRPRIGCSGWNYQHWIGNFYPASAPRTRWFELYASRFDTVEINNSFYRLPTEAAVESWRERAPVGFLFAWKASRYLTHLKRLRDPQAPLELMLSRARLLGRRLGPILFQLPPQMGRDVDRLRAFLDLLPRLGAYAFEFRHASWYDDQVFAALDRRNTTLCLHDMPGSATPRLALGGFVYVRFHGASGRYAGRYDRADLEPWAAWLTDQRQAGRATYAYFNNDVGGHAPRDADTLRMLVGEAVPATAAPRC